jgi:isoleucyl-tRNA synthetase
MASNDYKNTLNLPNTPFPMRANLPKREPEFLAKWEEMRICATNTLRMMETEKRAVR